MLDIGVTFRPLLWFSLVDSTVDRSKNNGIILLLAKVVVLRHVYGV